MARSPVVFPASVSAAYKRVAECTLDGANLWGLVCGDDGQVIFSWSSDPDNGGVYIEFAGVPEDEDESDYFEEGKIEFDTDGSSWVWVDDYAVQAALTFCFTTGQPVREYDTSRLWGTRGQRVAGETPELCQDRGCNAQQPWHPPEEPDAARHWCATCGGTLS